MQGGFRRQNDSLIAAYETLARCPSGAVFGRPTFNEPQKLDDVEWLGNIGITSAGEDFRLVSGHSKRSDRNDWDGARLLIGFEPSRCFHSRNIGQLNVHQDQIGTVLASKLKCWFA